MWNCGQNRNVQATDNGFITTIIFNALEICYICFFLSLQHCKKLLYNCCKNTYEGINVLLLKKESTINFTYYGSNLQQPVCVWQLTSILRFPIYHKLEAVGHMTIPTKSIFSVSLKRFFSAILYIEG